MTEAVIFFAAMLTFTIAILAALYVIVRDAPPQLQRNLIVGTAGGTSNKQSSQAHQRLGTADCGEHDLRFRG